MSQHTGHRAQRAGHPPHSLLQPISLCRGSSLAPRVTRIPVHQHANPGKLGGRRNDTRSPQNAGEVTFQNRHQQLSFEAKNAHL